MEGNRRIFFLRIQNKQNRPNKRNFAISFFRLFGIFRMVRISKKQQHKE
jgi:hypothetical protein